MLDGLSHHIGPIGFSPRQLVLPNFAGQGLGGRGPVPVLGTASSATGLREGDKRFGFVKRGSSCFGVGSPFFEMKRKATVLGGRLSKTPVVWLWSSIRGKEVVGRQYKTGGAAINIRSYVSPRVSLSITLLPNSKFPFGEGDVSRRSFGIPVFVFWEQPVFGWFRKETNICFGGLFIVGTHFRFWF